MGLTLSGVLGTRAQHYRDHVAKVSNIVGERVREPSVADRAVALILRAKSATQAAVQRTEPTVSGVIGRHARPYRDHVAKVSSTVDGRVREPNAVDRVVDLILRAKSAMQAAVQLTVLGPSGAVLANVLRPAGLVGSVARANVKARNVVERSVQGKGEIAASVTRMSAARLMEAGAAGENMASALRRVAMESATEFAPAQNPVRNAVVKTARDETCSLACVNFLHVTTVTTKEYHNNGQQSKEIFGQLDSFVSVFNLIVLRYNTE